MYRLTIFAIFTGCCLFCANAVAQQHNHHAIQWETNPHAAALKAQTESKAMLVHFTADWCRPCQNQKRFVFSNPSIVRTVHQNFVPVLIDIDAHKALAEQLNVRTIPYDVFLTPDGEVIAQRNSPTDSNNFLSMCRSVNYSPSEKFAQTNNGIDKFKRETSPMDVPLNQRGDFRAAGPDGVRHVGVSKEAQQLVNRSQFGHLIKVPRLQAKQSSAEKSDPKAELQKALAGLSNQVAASNPLKQKSPFFKIPEKRLENPATAYGSVTQEFHPDRAHENFDRRAFLAKRRPAVNVPRQAPAAQPIRVTNDEFFRQSTPSEMNESNSIPGVQVSAMFDLDTGQEIDPHVTGPSIARIQKEASSQTAEVRNEVKIIADSNARIRSYKENEAGSQQAAMVRDHGNANLLTADKPEAAMESSGEDFALNGKCPVALIQQRRWVNGDIRWGIVHRDRTYLFSSVENYERFKANPDRFSPILSGFDPVVFHEQGKLRDGLEENGVFMGQNGKQHIVLFQSPETRKKFQANPKLYMKTVRRAVYFANQQANAQPSANIR